MSASISSTGWPAAPKPPIITVDLSGMPATASTGESKNSTIGVRPPSSRRRQRMASQQYTASPRSLRDVETSLQFIGDAGEFLAVAGEHLALLLIA